MIRARLALGLLFLPLAAAAQNASAIGGASQTHSPTSAGTPKSTAGDFPQEPFVIEQYFTTAKFENDGTAEFDLNERIRVQSDAGVAQLGELVFGYNSASERIEIRFVRVRKSDGSIVTAGADAAKEVSASVARDAPVYTDYEEMRVTVP